MVFSGIRPSPKPIAMSLSARSMRVLRNSGDWYSPAPYEKFKPEGNSMTTDPVVIASYARTPMGGFQAALAGASATQLGAVAVKAAVERAGIDPEKVEQIFMGCVLPAGLGQAPARQAALGAG